MYQISCEDPIIHTSASPVCSDTFCPCHDDNQVVAIIRRHIAECEEAAARYDELEASGLRTIPMETIHRKQYAIGAQIDRLHAILEEIEQEQTNV